MEDFVFDRPFTAALLGAAVLLATIIGLAAFTSRATCHAQWRDSGMQARWGFVAGCQVQRKDGTWVPSSAIRDLAP